jgi:hypothetical protein
VRGQKREVSTVSRVLYIGGVARTENIIGPWGVGTNKKQIKFWDADDDIQ